MDKYTLEILWCSKYVCPFFNIMHERVNEVFFLVEKIKRLLDEN